MKVLAPQADPIYRNVEGGKNRKKHGYLSQKTGNRTYIERRSSFSLVPAALWRKSQKFAQTYEIPESRWSLKGSFLLRLKLWSKVKPALCDKETRENTNRNRWRNRKITKGNRSDDLVSPTLPIGA